MFQEFLFAHKLTSLATPKTADTEALVRSLGAPTRAEKGEIIARDGDAPGHVTILQDGFAIASKRLRDGQQQNVAMFVPGDLLDYESFVLGRSRAWVSALTPVTFYNLPHDRLRALLDDDPAFAEAFWRFVALQTMMAHEWILGMGRRSAYARTAHLLCELICRLRMVGRADTDSCEMPLTQSELADTLGLSTVHVNRVLQRLRGAGLIAIRRGRLDVLHMDGLVEAGGFEDSYLGLG